ncbi:MAG: fused MFS/spermidine synthase [Alphaproteobacteria bacterium]|nr:fused MFS/spermidine synthase [Alphaproteobacteria bacterium]
MHDTPTVTLPRGVALGIAFIAGWAIMQLEILGGRVLAPWFGYSVYQWGALIGVVMAALAAGYWLGGKVGDSPRATRFLLAALSISALFVLAVPPFAESFMRPLRALGPGWGAVVATAVLLGVPSVLLATTSPIVIRLTATEFIAKTAGRVYAVSTVGSIGGTFFAAFYVIPELGSRLGHLVAAGLIIVAAAALALSARQVKSLAALVVVSAVLTQIPSSPAPGVILRKETLHNIITVQDAGKHRYLYLNYTWAPQTVMIKNQVLTGIYYDLFLLGPKINDAKTVLFLGSAGGTALKQLTHVYPDLQVTGVDLDPEVVAIADKYFGLAAEPRIRQVAADARWFLTQTGDRYDMIAIDLYVTGHVPFFTTTMEFFRLAHDRLSENGILMMNILSPRPGDDLVGPMVRTARTAFPSTFLVNTGNYILIASKTPLTAEAVKRRLRQETNSAELRRVISRGLSTLRPASADPAWPIFTDDRNDVEFRTFRMLRSGF